MKLDKYIEVLLQLQKEHGNLDVVYSSDEEGNSFHKVEYDPSLGIAEDLNEYFIEIIHPDDAEEYGLSPNCIIIN